MEKGLINLYHNKIIYLIKNKNMKPIDIYSYYDDFKEEFVGLKYSTFSRDVRRLYNAYNEVEENVKENVKEENIIDSIKNMIFPKKISFNKKINSMLNRSGEKKRMVILSDTHSGHQFGLTPPDWQYKKDSIAYHSIAMLQDEMWEWYMKAVKLVGKKIDILVCNGDLIDGIGTRSGGTELITTDRLEQSKMAIEILNQWNAKNIFMTRGTPYHTGREEQFEDIIAKSVGAVIEDYVNISVYNTLFNFKHKVGSTTVPYSRATQVSKEATLNKLYAIYENEKSVDVTVRSHVHYFVLLRESSKIAMTTPALQINSRYGKQQCSGITDFGFIVVDVYKNGFIDIIPLLADLEYNKSIIYDI